MSEAVFSIKIFIASAVLVFLSQVKISEVTIENQIVSYARKSEISSWVHTVAAGGSKISLESYKFMKEKVSNLFGVKKTKKEEREDQWASK